MISDDVDKMKQDLIYAKRVNMIEAICKRTDLPAREKLHKIIHSLDNYKPSWRNEQ